MPKMTREEWLDFLQEARVEVAKLADSNPRKADLRAALKDFEEIEQKWTEMDERDPDLAERTADRIVRMLQQDR
jgi:hypothetical protein